MRFTTMLSVLSFIMSAPEPAGSEGGAAQVTFTDVTTIALPGVATAPGLDGTPPVFSGGAAVGNCDGDGLPDVFLAGSNHGVLYRNQGDGTFEDITVPANLGASGSKGGAAFGDIDNDGDVDLITTGDRQRVYVNDGTCTFTEEGTIRGFTTTTGQPESVSFGDYDRDGYLDIYVAEWRPDLRYPEAPRSAGHLFRNRGAQQPGYFVDVTTIAGVSLNGVPARQAGTFAYTGRFTDLDGDGWPDLAIASDFGQSRLFWNDHDGHFTDGTVASGVGTDEFGMGITTADLDGDGHFDLFVSSIFAVGGVRGNGNRLYRNLGNRAFADVTDAAGVRDGKWAWGVEAFDVDNDADLDLILNNGFFALAGDPFVFGEMGDIDATQFAPAQPRLWRNDAGAFTEVAVQSGLVEDGIGQGVIPFDYDGDGDLDVLFTSQQGQYGSLGIGLPRLFRNDGGNSNHWLDVELEGRASPRNGVGAIVTVTPVAGAPMVREVSASSTYLAQDGTGRVHFGLGPGPPAVDSVRIVWPSGVEQRVAARDVDGVLRVTEPASPRTPQDDCILSLNTAGARLAKKVGTRVVQCVRRATEGTLPAGQTAEACLASDPRGRIAAAEAETNAIAARKCAATPAFGPPSAPVVNAAMASLVRVRDVFGPNLDSALVDAHLDPRAAACQVAVARRIVRLATAELKAFNGCKAAGLAADTIHSAADLQACTATANTPAVLAAVARSERRAAAACAGTNLAAAFPGRCAGAAPGQLFACLEPQVQCGLCLALNGGDRLGKVCHRFMDGVATLYCGDRPVTNQTVARQWDEELLSAIRVDLPRPPIHARNLFHFSIAIWDAWAAYDPVADGYLVTEKHTSDDPNRDRTTAMSFAAYRVLRHRFQRSANAALSMAAFDARMVALGYDKNFTATDGATPAALGNRIAAAVIAHGMNDGANESIDYADPTYAPANDPMLVKLPGTTMNDPNRWQPLALDLQVTQNGIVLPGRVQKFVGPQWGRVLPFAVDFNTILPPPLLRLADPITDAGFKTQAVDLIVLASQLSPDDPYVMDVSPASLGNNPLATDDGHGYALNPVTGQPYTPQYVKRGDFGRVIAEFWADGPTSETPPGHWNVVANYVADHIQSKRLGGTGPVLDDLEWDAKVYLAVNAAVHDAAIGCWGTKRYYDGVRPISMIRYMGGLGQSSDPAEPHGSYDPNGIPLLPGIVEVITEESSAPGERHAELADHVGEIAIHSWPGPLTPTSTYRGIHWILATNWWPYQRATFVTPPFAGYPSGHSTFSRSAAEALRGLTGTEFFPGGLGEIPIPQDTYLQFEKGPSTGFMMQWATYYDAADQAGQSRRWGGIHPMVDDFVGRTLGSRIGQDAFAKALTYYDGTARP